MLKRTPITVLFTVVAIIVLFSATNSYPCTCPPPGSGPTCNCTPDKISRGECFKTLDGKFIVEIIPETGTGNFPWTVNGNSVFKYQICQPNPVQTISHINIQVGEPCKITPYPPNCNLNCESTPPGDWIPEETGESSTRFGAYDADFDVYKWITPTCWYYGTISLTMNGNVFAAPNQMLLKFGSSNFPVGKILGPSCVVPDKITTPAEIISHETVGEMTCYFDARGKLLDCVDEDNVALNKYPVGSVNCTLTGSSGQQMPLSLDFVSDLCKMSGHHSPGGMWVYVRGNWVCKCPRTEPGCICP